MTRSLTKTLLEPLPAPVVVGVLMTMLPLSAPVLAGLFTTTMAYVGLTALGGRQSASA